MRSIASAKASRVSLVRFKATTCPAYCLHGCNALCLCLQVESVLPRDDNIDPPLQRPPARWDPLPALPAHDDSVETILL